MKSILLVIGLLFVLTCKSQAKKVLLQSKDIQLVSPRIEVINQIIDSVGFITAELKINNVQINYTDNNKEPNKNSKLYTMPIKVSEPGVYKFKAFHKNWKSSDTEKVEFIKKGKSVDSIIWLSVFNNKYKGKGKKTLINHIKAKVDYMDSQWLGFDTVAQSIIVFKKLTHLQTVSIGYLNNPDAWIFPPEHIQILLSKDGVTFFEKKEFELKKIHHRVDQRVESYSLKIDEDVMAIKFEIKNLQKIPGWHDGAGKKAWLFMDEWIFY
jgi:hexosaminidase